MGDEQNKWFQEIKESKPVAAEIVNLETSETDELTMFCKESFDKNFYRLAKKNPSDAKWLETALHKGTLRDRANSGALLFQSNPLANLQALDVLIGLTKSTNKANTDVIDIITQLFMSSALPTDRKLVSLHQRGAQYKKMKANANIEKSYKEKVLMYWYFENELKDRYSTFLQNLESALRSGQDVHKNIAIVCTSKLLAFAPEKEQMLLTMLINKMGDPGAKVASKAQYHLIEVCHKHPNMCEVIVQAVDRFLFRPNLSERAQHVALTFLSEISQICGPKCCRKLVQVCFLFFKILVDKGMVNNRTMQAILRCLRRAVNNVEKREHDKELISKELQDIIYRLIYFADIQIAIQALGLLLQVFVPGQPGQDNSRFYTALYRKMVDMRLTTMTNKWTAQYLYIIHRAIALDSDIPRAKAFTRRLLQIGLYLPSHAVCGVLIIVNKLLLEKPEIGSVQDLPTEEEIEKIEAKHRMISEESDEEYYADVKDEGWIKKRDKSDKKEKKPASSWVHMQIKNEIDEEQEVKEETKPSMKANYRLPTKYDPWLRNPSGAGAEYEHILELVRVKEHFHPTVQSFVESINQNKKIDYYGDPLMDFSLTRFLDRFAFKNPKKSDEKDKETVIQSKHVRQKSYKQFGSRGMPVTVLTDKNCTEDERFIFQYLERRRQLYGDTAKGEDEESDNDDVDDNEFDSYLDGLGSKKSDEVDFMKEINELPVESTKSKKRKKAADDEDDVDNDEQDWKESGGEDQSDDDSLAMSGEDFSDEDLSNDDDEDDEVMTFSGDSEEEEESGGRSKGKSSKNMPVSEKEFTRKLKNSVDMSSLFAAADDFGELLEKTGKTKKHGTLDEVRNKDKASEKQLNWEQGLMNKSKKAGKTMLKTKSNKRFKKGRK